MSMATPLNNIPINTQHTNNENGDINDPMVQDVLNEFQEELMISQNHNTPPPPQQNIQHYQKPKVYISQPQQQNYNIPYYDKTYPYFNFEIMKSSLIMVIIAVLVFNSGIITQLYEKLPQYLSEKAENLDIYVKSLVLFIIYYILKFFNYI